MVLLLELEGLLLSGFVCISLSSVFDGVSLLPLSGFAGDTISPVPGSGVEGDVDSFSFSSAIAFSIYSTQLIIYADLYI